MRRVGFDSIGCCSEALVHINATRSSLETTQCMVNTANHVGLLILCYTTRPSSFSCRESQGRASRRMVARCTVKPTQSSKQGQRADDTDREGIATPSSTATPVVLHSKRRKGHNDNGQVDRLSWIVHKVNQGTPLRAVDATNNQEADRAGLLAAVWVPQGKPLREPVLVRL